jgi:hypothetical protein
VFGVPSTLRERSRQLDTATPASSLPADTASGSPPSAETREARRIENATNVPRVGPAAAATRVGVIAVPFAWLDSASRDTIERLRSQNEAQAWSTPARIPQAVTDAERREIYRERAERLAEKRPYPVRAGAAGASGTGGGGVGVGGSISVPIFEPGPSKAQRRRDSVVHAGNVDRFARIFARLRERQDSMLLASARDSSERNRIRDSLASARGLQP